MTKKKTEVIDIKLKWREGITCKLHDNGIVNLQTCFQFKKTV